MNMETNTQALFDQIYNLVKTKGELQKPPAHRMDNWAADTWTLGLVRVQLADGGYSRSIAYQGKTAYQTASFPIKYLDCNAQWLNEVLTALEGA